MKRIILGILIFTISLGLTGCSDEVSYNHLEIGILNEYTHNGGEENTGLLEHMQTTYNFEGHVKSFFEMDFPEEVTLVGDTRDVENLFYDTVTVTSNGFDGQSLYDYIISEIEEIFVLTTCRNEATDKVCYINGMGDIIEVTKESDSEVKLFLYPGARFMGDINNTGWYIFHTESSYQDFEDFRDEFANSCPACNASEVVDGKFTYIYYGITFQYSDDTGVTIDGETLTKPTVVE
jgi:hypothetical protein